MGEGRGGIVERKSDRMDVIDCFLVEKGVQIEVGRSCRGLSRGAQAGVGLVCKW